MVKYHIKFHFRQQLALQGGLGSTYRVLSYVTVSQHLSYGQLVEVIFFFMTVKGEIRKQTTCQTLSGRLYLGHL